MRYKLQKWICPKCGLEYWSLKGVLCFKCWECGIYCNWAENIWKINEENY